MVGKNDISQHNINLIIQRTNDSYVPSWFSELEFVTKQTCMCLVSITVTYTNEASSHYSLWVVNVLQHPFLSAILLHEQRMFSLDDSE